ncbi:nitric oxide reductase transcriptional regulator NorR [Vibrio algicola]|uniref:Nitric oxide reductase transcriptional regulator NorR n=1 Tax=Vibrio algicola TaxID=2662262 RepID=A0A5Q0TH55_9VIBR|nr:nitric oxide reductase transcriptional regulator NorR [Vibrio algicola]
MQQFHTQITQLALDLTLGISNQDRFDRLLEVLRNLLKCDAAALLAYRDQQFVPLAIDGLYEEVMGRRFNINEHPRLEAIARAGDVVRFPADSDIADPYDGLIPNKGDKLHVHACVGLPLIAHGNLIGALTIDGFDAHQFDQFSDRDLRTISALAAASLHTSLLMKQLELQVVNVSANSPQVTKDIKLDEEMIGQSGAMMDLRMQIQAVANTDLSVLVMGETGVGKELVAASIHAQSNRAKQTLVYLNCAALPESVAESELFGHVKGAFTGAISHRKGKFELADNGTLFLDEVGELPLGLQSKLLRVLQYGDLQRVGDDSVLKVNTRIVAATNRDLHQDVVTGQFRADLYHRLSVFPIHVPALREREGDTTLLSGFFIEKCKNKLNLNHLSISPAALNLLRQYPWPGNVRQLEHSIHRAAVLARTEIFSRKENMPSSHVILQPHHFELTQAASSKPQSSSHQTAANENLLPQTLDLAPNIDPQAGLKQATEDFQTQIITTALNNNQQNWAATARDLQIDSGNLHRLAKRLGLKN